MGLLDNIKAAAAPVSASFTKYQVFAGTLLIVVPHRETPSKFPREDGSVKMQTVSTIIPLEDGSVRRDDGTKVEWKAGEVHTAFIDGAKIRRQLTEMDVPVLGRLVKGKPSAKGGRPWELATPDDDDKDILADAGVEALEEKIKTAIADAKAYAERQTATESAAPAKATVDTDQASVPW